MNNTDEDYSDYEYIKYPFEWKFRPEEMQFKIRSSIFMVIGASAGLPALVWSVGELIDHRKNGHRISVFIILLLLTDFTELYLSPYILIKDLLDRSNIGWTYWILWSLWWSLRVCGLLLNQLVALEGILSVKYPLYTAAVFSSCCFRVFYTRVLLCLIISGLILLFLDIIEAYHYVFPVSAFILSVITWIISCGASCSAERHSHTSRKTDPHIVIIFIFNLLVLYGYLTAFLFSYSLYSDLINIVLTFSGLLMSLRLISDPLLCVLVCRQNLSVQTTRNPKETSVQPE